MVVCGASSPRQVDSVCPVLRSTLQTPAPRLPTATRPLSSAAAPVVHLGRADYLDAAFFGRHVCSAVQPARGLHRLMAVSDRSLCFSSSNAAAMNNNAVLSSVQAVSHSPRTRSCSFTLASVLQAASSKILSQSAGARVLGLFVAWSGHTVASATPSHLLYWRSSARLLSVVAKGRPDSKSTTAGSTLSASHVARDTRRRRGMCISGTDAAT